MNAELSIAHLIAQASVLVQIIMGVLILGEPFTLWVVAGTLLVLTGVWLLARWR